MPKRSRGVARRRIDRTSGQSASALDNEFLHAETDKTSDLALDTVGPGEVMSGNQGVKISDDQNSLKAGLRGPTLMEDFHLREKITHFDHERVPERVVHARGAAAHGVFQVYEDLSDLTMAGLLTDPSRQTPVFVRFSTVAVSRGSTDCARCGRTRWELRGRAGKIGFGNPFPQRGLPPRKADCGDQRRLGPAGRLLGETKAQDGVIVGEGANAIDDLIAALLQHRFPRRLISGVPVTSAAFGSPRRYDTVGGTRLGAKEPMRIGSTRR
jgi:hypothetical protein